MGKLKWDQDGERYFETGTRHGVLYPKDDEGGYKTGVPWNGLINVNEKPSGAEETALYADDIKYLSLRSKEEFGATIEAYTYPDEFTECDGSASLTKGVYIGQQKRRAFGLCYRSTVGNDIDSEAGYKLHLVYNATASASEKAYQSQNDSPDAITFSWDVTTVPVEVTGHNPTAIVTIDTTKLDDSGRKNLAVLEEYLYGRDAVPAEGTEDAGDYVAAVEELTPTFLMPDDVLKIMENGSLSN